MNEYPENWPDISKRVKDKANWQCESCEAAHDPPTAHTLTVAHLDNNKANCADWNLAALCQRCHLSVQSYFDFDQLLFGFFPPDYWLNYHIEGYQKALLTNL